MAFSNETALTYALIGAVVLAFVVMHLALRRIPWTEAVPRERFRWPVWNWYAMVVGIGIVFGLLANLYWNARVEDELLPETVIHRTSGQDTDDFDTDDEKVSGERARQAPAPAKPKPELKPRSELLTPEPVDKVLVSGRMGAEIVQASPTPPVPDPLGSPEPIASATPPVPDPLASPTATSTPVTTPLPTLPPAETPSPEPAVSPL